jgi:4-amino-4-deoxy-L-arabinose transferase-like glycosyltransferase
MGSGIRTFSSGTFVIWSLRLLLAATALVLLMTHLRDWPPPWIDEGVYLGAAQVLATDGLYGLRDDGKVSRFDSQVQVGPPVIAPVALGLRLLGDDQQAARLVMVAFSLGALLAAGLLAREAFDERTALLTVALLLAGSTEYFCSLVFLGRQVLGEVPAFGFYAAGMALLVSPVRSGQRAIGRELGAGLLLGAAMLSKPQLLPLIPAAMLMVAIAGTCYYRRRVWPLLVLPMLVGLGLVVIWYAVRWLASPGGGLTTVTQLKPSWIAGQLFTTEWIDRRRALSVLARSGFVILGLPSLLWGLWSARRRDADGLTRLLLLVVPCTVLAWFVGASVGWARYAFFAVAMSAMWSASLLWHLWDLVGRARFGRVLAQPLLGAACALLLIANSAATVRAIAHPPATGFDEMRQYLRTQVESNAVIETWEWEFSVDQRPTYTHPDADTLYATIRFVMSNQPLPPTLYDWRRRHPDYLLLGPFGEWTGIYRLAMLSDVELVTRRTRYALYRVRKPLDTAGDH